MARIDAGALRDRVEVLMLSRSRGAWKWRSIRTVWAKVEWSSARNLFSSVGLAARTVTVTMRARPLVLPDALRYKGQHLFLTDIGRPENGYMTVTAAAVELVDCRANPGGTPPGVRFPAVLTEKWLRHEQEEPMAVNQLCYVLVTPKRISLRPGTLVDVAGVAHQVLLAHELDLFKNEYEILRTRDL